MRYLADAMALGVAHRRGLRHWASHDLATIQAHANVAPGVLPVAAHDPVIGDRVFAIRALKYGQELVEGSIVLSPALGKDFLVGIRSLLAERLSSST
jgi:hypothetical protein